MSVRKLWFSLSLWGRVGNANSGFSTNMILLKDNAMEYVGLIPAGGKATRISPLPCSKEIFPVGFANMGQSGQLRPKVAAHYLLEKMRLAGAQKAYIVLAKGKWDIPAYFGNGSMVDMALGYLMTDISYGVPFTLDSAFPFIKNKHVLFGFPDIILQPDDVYIRMIKRLNETRADIVLGLFLAENPQKMDMVELHNDKTIRTIHIKPLQTNLKWTWITAVWNETFTRFMHDVVSRHLTFISTTNSKFPKQDVKELFMGDVIQDAIKSELKTDLVMLPQGKYIDIGSPEDMVSAVQSHTS